MLTRPKFGIPLSTSPNMVTILSVKSARIDAYLSSAHSFKLHLSWGSSASRARLGAGGCGSSVDRLDHIDDVMLKKKKFQHSPITLTSHKYKWLQCVADFKPTCKWRLLESILYLAKYVNWYYKELFYFLE